MIHDGTLSGDGVTVRLARAARATRRPAREV